MGFFSRIFGSKKKKKTQQAGSEDLYSSSDLRFYINMDNTSFGPFTLAQIKTYPLLEDTLITTNTLNGEWYEARYFECFDDLFKEQESPSFRIADDGTIIRN